jgi:hypothetical protein
VPLGISVVPLVAVLAFAVPAAVVGVASGSVPWDAAVRLRRPRLT